MHLITDSKQNSAAADGVRAAEANPTDDRSVSAFRYEIHSGLAVINNPTDDGHHARTPRHLRA
jgi:hypothetical protein